jgi:hypothetical protein
MSDIFISYAREDLPKARLLAEAMIADGLSVWWDHELLGGDQFREAITQTIATAKVVIVIWSENSVQSPFVKDEASRANARGVLLPVAIGEVEPPVGFGELQTIRFKRWAETTAEWETLVRTVAARLQTANQVQATNTSLLSARRELSFLNRNIDVFLLILFAQSLAAFLIFQPLHFLSGVPEQSETGFVVVTSIILAGIHTSGLIARRVGLILRLVSFAVGAAAGFLSYKFAGAILPSLIALGENASSLQAGAGLSMFNALIFFIYIVVSGAILLLSDR